MTLPNVNRAGRSQRTRHFPLPPPMTSSQGNGNVSAMSETTPPAIATVVVETHAKFFRGLADPARLGLLLALRDAPRSAGELARSCDLSPSNASNHLQCLLECGLVEVEARGRQNLYRLVDAQVIALLDTSERILRTSAGPLIEACRTYGPPSRRALRVLEVEP